MHLLLSISRLRSFPHVVKVVRPMGKAFVWTLILTVMSLASNNKLMATEPELCIRTVNTTEGQIVKASIQYTANGAKVSALQVDLHYSRTAISNISATVGAAATAAGKMLASAVLSNGNIRYLIFGLNQTVIGNGSVVDLKITMASEVEPASYPLQMLNAVASDPNGNGVPIQVSSGNVVVPPPDN